MARLSYARLGCTAIVLLALTAMGANAADLKVRVTDQNGNPLSGTVVELPLNPVSRATTDTAIIDQINKRFVPMVIAIQQGQNVNFPNNDNIRHHVYSFSPIKQFSTDLYADIPGDPVMFETPGIAVLGCNIHDTMIGYIYVSAWQDTAVTEADGMVSFPQTEIPATINIWHPWSTDPENRREVSTATLPDNGTLEVQLTVTEPTKVFGFRALTND